MIMKGVPAFEEKSLSAVRNFHPCIHSRDFYGTGTAYVAACRNRGCPDNNIGLYALKNVGGKII